DLKKIFASIHDYIGLIYKIIEDDKQTELNMCYFDREQDFFYYGGMGGGSIVPKINLVELDVNNYRELYVFNSLDFEIPMKQMKNIDIHILPSESCQIEYSIEYFYKVSFVKLS
ncbi:hypothetical protein NNE72_13780, partial [Enterococcus faecium]|nr:hypothetical protein [Enterococcus faecium]